MFLRHQKYWFGFYFLPIFPGDNRNIFLDLFEAILSWSFLKGFWGFENSPIQLSFEFKHEDMMIMQGQAKAKLGLWQLNPTKQESRPEIQDVR